MVSGSWARYAPLSGLLFAVLLVVAIIVGGFDSVDSNDSVQKVSDGLAAIQKKLANAPDNSGGAGPPLPDEPRPLLNQINGVASGLDSYTAAPTADELTRIDDLSKQLRDLLAELNKFIAEDVANLNKQLRDSGYLDRAERPGSYCATQI